MKRFINRASLLASVTFFCAIPLGMAAEARDLIVMPDRFEVAFLIYFWVFAIIHFITRSNSPG